MPDNILLQWQVREVKKIIGTNNQIIIILIKMPPQMKLQIVICGNINNRILF